jgi:hypothetical protein
MKKIFLISVILFMANIHFAHAQKKPSKSNKTTMETEFNGTIKKKPWSKSTQSYCAGGSDYFVLVIENNEEIVLQNNTGEELDDLDGKEVTIIGKKVTKTIKNNNPMEQRPVSRFKKDGEDTGFQCTVLDVTKIK